MYPKPSTLAEFFKAQSGGDIVTEALKSSERTEIKGIPGLGWELAKKKFDGAFWKMLDVKIEHIFCDALILPQDLQTYLDRDKHPPGKVYRKTLAGLTISSKHQPKLEILLEQNLLVELTFDVILELKLESFKLKIQDGRIREIAAGTYQGAATIACRGQVLASVPSREYSLPGKIVFEPGLRIPRLEKSKPLPQARLRQSSADGGNYSQPRPGQPAAWLIGIEGHVRGQRYPVDKAHYRIGSKADNDLCIKGDDYLSGKHAYLRYEQGNLYLFDQGSRNGTFLNSQQVTEIPYIVRRGDHIRFGESVFLIQ